MGDGATKFKKSTCRGSYSQVVVLLLHLPMRGNGMKHLRFSISDMRRLFERAITVKDIAEPFASFDVDQPVLTVRKFLKSKYYDVVGIRRNGVIEDYALTSELEDGKLGRFAKTFEPEAQVSDAAINEQVDLSDCLELCDTRPQFSAGAEPYC